MSTDQQTPTPEQTSAAESGGTVVARAGSYYRNARYIMFAIILLMGFWFLYDGFVKYPNHNKEYDRLTSEIQAMEKLPKREESNYQRLLSKRTAMGGRKSDMSDILPQKVLGFSLPPIGIGLLIYWLRKSRGEIKLENKVLTAPGFPPINLHEIDELDKDLWDKKGIAFVYYTLADKTTGKLRLDDFIYQARPIREIVKQIELEMKAQDELIAQARTANPESAPATPAA